MLRETISSYNTVKTIDGKFVCDCGKVYKRKSDMARHQREECGKEPQFMCRLCPYRAKRKSSLVKHNFCRHRNLNVY